MTIQDIAKPAGMSISTISLVRNGKAGLASETQNRILSVIGDPGYTTNLAARSIRSHKRTWWVDYAGYYPLVCDGSD